MAFVDKSVLTKFRKKIREGIDRDTAIREVIKEEGSARDKGRRGYLWRLLKRKHRGDERTESRRVD